MILKVVRIAELSLCFPMWTNLQSLTRQENVREQIKLSNICGDLVELKDHQVV